GGGPTASATLLPAGPAGFRGKRRPAREAIRTSTSRRRSLLRRPPRRARVLDGRTKRLVSRALPGDIAVIDHEDRDRVSAEGLVRAGVAAVVNAARSTTGRYPNLGPAILLEAGIPLVDGVGPLLLRKVREG